MCMGNPRHIYHPTTGEIVSAYGIDDIKQVMTEATEGSLTFKDVEFDPSIDPSNMDQYLPKVYKVEPVYEKRVVDDVISESSESSESSELSEPPPYEKCHSYSNRWNYDDKCPPYDSRSASSPYGWAVNEADRADNSESPCNTTSRPAGRLLLSILFLWFILMQFMYIPMDCNEPAPEEEYNMATIIYSLDNGDGDILMQFIQLD